MSGIGFTELLILFLIGLIVLGPEKLPRVANQLGTWLGQARRMTRVMKRQLEEELSLEEKQSSCRPASLARPGYVTPANDTDDTFSPVHGPGDKGIGVGDEAPGENIVADDPKNLDNDVDSALAPDSPARPKESS